MKTLSLIYRRPDLSQQAFRDYYENTHCWLAMRHFPFARYERNHVMSGNVEFDCMSVFELDADLSGHDLMTSGSRKLVMQDELEFMDPEKIQVFPFHEVWLDLAEAEAHHQGERSQWLVFLKTQGATRESVESTLKEWLNKYSGSIHDANIKFLQSAGITALQADAILWVDQSAAGAAVLSECPFATKVVGVQSFSTPVDDLRQRFEGFKP